MSCENIIICRISAVRMGKEAHEEEKIYVTEKFNAKTAEGRTKP